jgi:chromate transport protein ChrA
MTQNIPGPGSADFYLMIGFRLTGSGSVFTSVLLPFSCVTAGKTGGPSSPHCRAKFDC